MFIGPEMRIVIIEKHSGRKIASVLVSYENLDGKVDPSEIFRNAFDAAIDDGNIERDNNFKDYSFEIATDGGGSEI